LPFGKTGHFYFAGNRTLSLCTNSKFVNLDKVSSLVCTEIMNYIQVFIRKVKNIFSKFVIGQKRNEKRRVLEETMGLWVNKKKIKNSAEWVEKLRKKESSRHERLFDFGNFDLGGLREKVDRE